MKAHKTIFFCSDCGHETSKWVGCCPACGSWNSMTDSESVEGKPQKKGGSASARRTFRQAPVLIDEVDHEDIRTATGISELDRVLGGGMVKGSLVLVGGEPGIGKSTLLMQLCGVLSADKQVLYVSGEESASQLKLRARRLDINTGGISVLCDTDMQSVIEYAGGAAPDFVIIDSIQTMSMPDVQSVAGSVTQVRECTLALMQMSKGLGITVFVIGHVNKEGAIAGPKVLEHMVDCVLCFEGDRNFAYRILRASKNRYGSTNEIGVFEMSGNGLVEVHNPSEMLLSNRPTGVSGTCVACSMEGSRPLLAEIQALITNTVFGTPRRMTAGIDYNRAMLLLAVLEKRAGLFTGSCDAYISVVSGLKLDEPAADLPTALAIASSFKDKPISDDLAAFGEIGLTGELRPVPAAEQRIEEIRRLGFARCILPKRSLDKVKSVSGIELIGASNISEAMRIIFS